MNLLQKEPLTYSDGIFHMEMLGEACNSFALDNYSTVVELHTSKKWIKHGEKDTMPLTFLMMYKRSLTHKRLVDFISRLIAGTGFSFTVPEQVCMMNADGFYENVNVDVNPEDEIARAEMWAKNVLLRRYIQDAARNLAIHGGYYGMRQREVGRIPRDNFALGGTESYTRRLIVEPFENIRMGQRREFIDNQFTSTDFFISNDFTQAYRKCVSYEQFKQNPQKLVGRIPVFSEADVQGRRLDQGRGMFCKFVGNVTNYRDYYPTPHYESKGAMFHINVDYLLAENDHIDLIKGFPVEHIITVNRQPLPDNTKEQAKRVSELKHLKGKFEGVKGSRTAVFWAIPEVDDSGRRVNTDPITITPVPNGKSVERFGALRIESKNAIFGAHGLVTPELAGFPSNQNGGLQNQSNKLITGQKLFQTNIEDFQNKIIEDVNEELLRARIFAQLNITNSQIHLKEFSDQLISDNFTQNEIRQMAGAEPLEEQVINSQTIQE